ncbi:endothelin-converting enzyme homolog [Ixodes scapularis]
MDFKDVHYLLALAMLRLLMPFAYGNVFASKHPDSAPECVARVEAIMEPALWAPHFFNETWTETVAKAKLTISDLRNALRSRLEKAAWMDVDSRKFALRKLDNTAIFTGFPDAVSDEKRLNKYYEKYQWDDGEFFRHWINGAFERHQSLIHKQNDVFFSVSAPRVIYAESASWAAVAPALLQPPFFIKDGPDSFNYGSLGQLVVSALMHGYDVRGSEIDDRGERKTWWTDSTRERYTARLDCLRSSASEVQYQGADAPEDLLVEIDSLSVAYKAFLELPADKRSVVLPGLQFSSSQIFFVAHCAKMCELSEGIEHGRLTSRTKCVVPLRHEPNFAHAFKCYAGSRMNPEQKCSVW